MAHSETLFCSEAPKLQVAIRLLKLSVIRRQTLKLFCHLPAITPAARIPKPPSHPKELMPSSLSRSMAMRADQMGVLL